jgi:transcriptional regulator with XRE-family HTH domain
MPATAKRFPKEADMKRTKFNLPINDRLKKVRHHRNLSLRKVVELLKNEHGLELATSTLQGYEASESNQNHRYPSSYVLLTLANLYNCSLDFIYGLSDEMERPSKDVFDNVLLRDKVLWKGQEMSDAQKAMLVEKGDTIMKI